MSGQHTPGPWEAEFSEDFRPMISNGSSNIAVCSYPDEGCEKANARLIAASPTMFEALVKLERWFDTDPEILAAMDPDTRADHERQHGMIRAAIAQAKGGAA